MPINFVQTPGLANASKGLFYPRGSRGFQLVLGLLESGTRCASTLGESALDNLPVTCIQCETSTDLLKFDEDYCT